MASLMIDALNDFLAVAACGSFSQVAKKQAVAVSSVTRKIDWLEAEVGSRLFHRSSRRVVLTDAGEQFMPRARNILNELAEAKEAISSANDDPRGLLSITAPTIFGRLHLAPAIANFLRRYPGVEIELHLSDQVIDLVERRLDVAIRIGLLPDSDLHAVTLAPLRQITCVSPSYIEHAGKPEEPGDLLHHDCITVATMPAAAGAWCYEGVNRNQPLPVSGCLRTDDKGGMLQGALAGLGIVQLPSWLVFEDIQAGRLIPLFADIPQPSQRARPAIHAVRLPGRSHEVKAKLFIAHLQQAVGIPAYWDVLRGVG
jgi:DNA-binding transcriptional LysR family regulator